MKNASSVSMIGCALAFALVVTGPGPAHTLSPGSPSPDADAIYVSPNGDDGNPGTLEQPFATLEKAQAALRSDPRRKTVYLRAGLYKRATMLKLTSADNGQTWSHYPPDGYNSPILDASAMAFSACNTSNVILIQGGNHITINGLRIRNFARGGGITIHGGPAYPDVRAGGCFVYGRTGPAHGNVISNNIIHNVGDGADNVYPWGWFAGIAAWGDVKNTTIRNNAVHDVGGIGISLNVLQMGPRNGIDGSIVRNNAVYNANRASSAGDLGGYYVIDRTGTSVGVALINNYLRDYGDPTRRIKGLYLDDGASNVTVEGNLVVGPGTWAVQIHSGNRNRFAGNIFDLGQSGRQWALLYQNSAGKGNMTGNVFERNLVVADFASTTGLDGNVYYSGYSRNGFEYPSVQDNVYWNAQQAVPLPHQGDIRDTSPAAVDPELIAPFYKLPPQSPVFSLPVPFPRQPENWGEPGFWGPPGYVVPPQN